MTVTEGEEREKQLELDFEEASPLSASEIEAIKVRMLQAGYIDWEAEKV